MRMRMRMRIVRCPMSVLFISQACWLLAVGCWFPKLCSSRVASVSTLSSRPRMKSCTIKRENPHHDESFGWLGVEHCPPQLRAAKGTHQDLAGLTVSVSDSPPPPPLTKQYSSVCPTLLTEEKRRRRRRTRECTCGEPERLIRVGWGLTICSDWAPLQHRRNRANCFKV